MIVMVYEHIIQSINTIRNVNVKCNQQLWLQITFYIIPLNLSQLKSQVDPVKFPCGADVA